MVVAPDHRITNCVIGCRAASVAAYLVLMGVNHDMAALVLGLVFAVSFLIIRGIPTSSRRGGVVHSITVVIALSLVCVWGGVLVQNVAGLYPEELAAADWPGVTIQPSSSPHRGRIDVAVGFPLRGVTGQHHGGWFGSDFGGAERLAWAHGLPVFWLNWLIAAVVAGLLVWRVPDRWIQAVHPWAVFAAVMSVIAGEAWLDGWGEPAVFGF